MTHHLNNKECPSNWDKCGKAKELGVCLCQPQNDDAFKYDRFIRSALDAGFTDPQIDFLEEWFYK